MKSISLFAFWEGGSKPKRPASSIEGRATEPRNNRFHGMTNNKNMKGSKGQKFKVRVLDWDAWTHPLLQKGAQGVSGHHSEELCPET